MRTNVEELTVGTKIGTFEVTGIKNIINHGEYYPNINVVCEVFVKGFRGATYQGWVKQDGSVELMTRFGTQKPLFEGVIYYDGTKGCIVGA